MHTHSIQWRNYSNWGYFKSKKKLAGDRGEELLFHSQVSSSGAGCIKLLVFA